jgi:hypothetical protein
LWIREICKILNESIVPDKNATKTKVSLRMAKKGAVKGQGSQIVEITLGRGEEGAGAKHVRHHKKISRKFTQLPRVSEQEESLARLVKCKANEGLRGVLNVETSDVDKM